MLKNPVERILIYYGNGTKQMFHNRSDPIRSRSDPDQIQSSPNLTHATEIKIPHPPPGHI